jgi:hypothetical protein
MREKAKYVVIDDYVNPWGPFDSAQEADAWATKKWGDNAEVGWMVNALRSPDEP